ncbi:MAG: tetratricopeptide repeat-containing protein kinase family protein, partial [Acidobacteriota bacterium]
FAAPEQIEGGQITTATDVWALGLILHELLTGRRLDRAKAASEDSAPQRPSSAVSLKSSTTGSPREELSEIASSRGLSPSRLRHRLKGDLDLIILQALRRRPEERYASASALAEDIQRHLDGFPISARNESFLLRSRAFFRRNRGAVAAGLAILLALVGGLLTTLQQAHERGRQAEIAEGVSDFLVELFAGSDPSQALGTSPTALELLDRGAQQLESESQRPSEIHARLMREIGWVYFHLGRYRRAAHFAGLSLLQSQERYGWDSLKTAGPERLWGSCLWKLGRYEEAVSVLRHALRTQVNAGDDPAAGETLSALGAVCSTLGRHGEAEAVHRQALEISRRHFGLHSVESATDLQNIATVLWRQGKLSEAETFARQALDMRLAITGGDSVATGSSLQALGHILRDQEKIVEAEDCFRRAVNLREKIYHGVHPHLAQSLSSLSEVLMKAGRRQESLELAERSVQINRQVYGPDHSELATRLNNLGNRYYQLGDYEKAADSLREALEIWRRTLPPEHPNITTALSNIGMILLADGRLTEAEALMRKSIDQEQQKDQPLYGKLCLSLCNLGRILDAQGRQAEAISSLEESRRLAQENLDPQDSLLETIERHLSKIRGHSNLN